MSPWLAFARAVAPTPAEQVTHIRDYLVLLGGSPPVAEYAQEVVASVQEAGLLAPEVMTESGEQVLLRGEKKLVRAHLSWLDGIATRDRSYAAQVVIVAAVAFGNPDAALQERALAVVARHLPAAGEQVLHQLRAAAEQVGPGLATRVADLLGMPTAVIASRVADVIPPIPVPTSVPGPLAAVEQVAAVLAGDRDVVAFERALDGLVRHSYRDRAALAAALGPATRKEPRWDHDHRAVELYDVARAVRDEPPRELDFLTSSPHTLAGDVLLARMREAADAVRSGTVPFLLAVPTVANGALDAAVLVERLTVYEKLDVTPGPADLAQALLRPAPTEDRAALAAVDNLHSDAGRRAERWLRSGGTPFQDSAPEDWDPYPYTAHLRYRILRRSCPELIVDGPLPVSVAALVGPYAGKHQGCETPSRSGRRSCRTIATWSRAVNSS